MEKVSPPPKFDLVTELRNICINIPLLQALREIPIYAKTIKDLYIKNLGKKRAKPCTIPFVGRVVELMTRCAQFEKYFDLRNPVIFVQIGDILIPNVLVDLGATINIMTRQTME